MSDINYTYEIIHVDDSCGASVLSANLYQNCVQSHIGVNTFSMTGYD